VARLMLCGDVMTGRGVDQILPHPGDARLHETWARSALRYVELAEEANGPIEKPRDFAYIWGHALEEIERRAPHARIANLETAVTTSDDAWQGKGIHYRMHPGNVACLAAARLDCCVLANNHVLDWGRGGLAETLATLRGAGIRHAGAGRDADEAGAPAVLELSAGGRVLVVGAAFESSGVPPQWAAATGASGVNLVRDPSPAGARALVAAAQAVRKPTDLLVVSIHWGDNWGYAIDPGERAFAHALVDAGVDIVHGHSSHHGKAIEVHANRPILYGCGDLVNDYEGIEGEEVYRPDLRMIYFVDIEPGAGLGRLQVVPFRARRMRLERASLQDRAWVAGLMDREARRFGAAPAQVVVA